MAKLYHRDATACSVAGKSYKRGDDGSFDVPEEAVAGLVAHGFVTSKRLAAAGPDEQLVKDAGAADQATAHAKAELAAVSAERDALAGRVQTLEAERDKLLAAVAGLQADLDEATSPKKKR